MAQGRQMYTKKVLGLVKLANHANACIASPRERRFTRALAWFTRFTIPKKYKGLVVV